LQLNNLGSSSGGCRGSTFHSAGSLVRSDTHSLSRCVPVLLQSFLLLVKDSMSENEVPFSGSGFNRILKLVPSDD
jgi:hypothetical protein